MEHIKEYGHFEKTQRTHICWHKDKESSKKASLVFIFAFSFECRVNMSSTAKSGGKNLYLIQSRRMELKFINLSLTIAEEKEVCESLKITEKEKRAKGSSSLALCLPSMCKAQTPTQKKEEGEVKEEQEEEGEEQE